MKKDKWVCTAKRQNIALQNSWLLTVYFTYTGPNINASHGKDGNNNGKVGYETTDPVGKETLGFEFFQMPGYQKGANE